MRRSALLLSLALLLTAAAPVEAQEEGAAPVEAPPAPPEPIGEFSLHLLSGVSDRGETYVMKGQRVRVRGRAALSADGRSVIVDVARRGGGAAAIPAVLKADRDAARFTVEFTARRSARYSVSARDEGGAQLARPLSVQAVRPRAGSGSRGLKVRLLQKGLSRLGYVTPTGGRFGAGTARAVVAFRKVNSMARTGFASRSVYAKLLDGRGGFRLKYPGAGKHVEYDISRQVLVLARDGRAERIYHSSSGAGGTPTVLGSFRFYRKQPGTNSLGMLHSNYFIGGYAIHGYPSVPNYPASHGCLRVPNPNAASIDAWIKLGDRIFVYR